mgnify:FL=1|jgi:hypothetical protein
MKVREAKDHLDSTYMMIIHREENEDFSSLAMFRKAFKNTYKVDIEQFGNYTMIFTTDTLKDEQSDRVYLVCWSDICVLLREGKVVIRSYTRI